MTAIVFDFPLRPSCWYLLAFDDAQQLRTPACWCEGSAREATEFCDTESDARLRGRRGVVDWVIRN